MRVPDERMRIMFPTANSQVYYNEDGEVLGWDGPSYDEPDFDDFDDLD